MLCYVTVLLKYTYLRVINDRLQQFFVFKPKLLSACDSVKLTGKLAARRRNKSSRAIHRPSMRASIRR